MRKTPIEYLNLKKSDASSFDVHTHIFNHRCVPNGFLGVRLPFTDRFLNIVEKATSLIGNITGSKEISNTSYFIDMFNKEMPDILAKMMSYYPETMVFSILSMDMTNSVKGKMQCSYEEQLKAILALQKLYPSRIIPFLCVNPRNPNMMDIFMKYMNISGDKCEGFWGVKVYPALGYLPSHPELMHIFAICEKHGIPVTTHCSSAFVHSTDRHFKNVKGLVYNDEERKVQPITYNSVWCWSNDDYSDFFNHPKNWKPVLETFPKLKLNLAHFGGLVGGKNAWYLRIIDLIEQYPNVYTDISFTIGEYNRYKRLYDILTRNEHIANRVLFGSDYYMIVIKDHFRTILSGITSFLGQDLIEQIATTNPKNFLFN